MSGTRRSLTLRLTALLALTVTAAGALLMAYAGVHRSSAPLRIDSASAMLDVTAAQTALVLANSAAQDSLRTGRGELVGTGTAYRTQIMVANNSLARTAQSNVAGESGRRALQTVVGLITAYTGWIEQASRSQADSRLRTAYLHYADRMLTRSDSGILARLDALQAEQRRTVDRQTAFDWPLRLGWVATGVLFLTLAGLLIETQRFVRRHFRRRVNPWLLSATLVVLAVVPLTVFTAQSQSDMNRTREHLARTVSAWQRAESSPTEVAAVGGTIKSTAKEVSTQMRNTGWRADLAGWTPVLGLLLAALIVRGLQPRITEYRYESR
jgi:hypothetical protein